MDAFPCVSQCIDVDYYDNELWSGMIAIFTC